MSAADRSLGDVAGM